MITKQAAIVDPGFDSTKILQYLISKKLNLEYIIVTHHHSDHSSDCKKIKSIFPQAKIVASEADGKKLNLKQDIVVTDQSQLTIGNIFLDFLLTPGHTPGGICIIVDNKAICTGDILFIGDCGRTDLPGGNLTEMYTSLQEKIMNLPDELIVYPGHDYGEKPFDSLGNQKNTNKTLKAKTLKEFSKIA